MLARAGDGGGDAAVRALVAAAAILLAVAIGAFSVIVRTLTTLATLVAAHLPEGKWTAAFTDTFFHGESITYVVLGIVVGVIAGIGALTLTNSRNAEEAH